MADNETDDATERKQRLQALRNAHKEGVVDNSSDNNSGKGRFKGKSGAESGGADDRKREFVKRLLQKRMQEGGGGNESGPRNAGQNKQLRRKALMGKSGKGVVSSGEGLDKFPRLKAMLEQRQNQTKDTGSVPVEELEERVSRLENDLKETRKKIDDVKESKLKVVSNDTNEEGNG